MTGRECTTQFYVYKWQLHGGLVVEGSLVEGSLVEGSWVPRPPLLLV